MMEAVFVWQRLVKCMLDYWASWLSSHGVSVYILLSLETVSPVEPFNFLFVKYLQSSWIFVNKLGSDFQTLVHIWKYMHGFLALGQQVFEIGLTHWCLPANFQLRSADLSCFLQGGHFTLFGQRPPSPSVVLGTVYFRLSSKDVCLLSSAASH